MNSNYMWLAAFLVIMFLFVWGFVHGAKKGNEQDVEHDYLQDGPLIRDSFPWAAALVILLLGGLAIWLFDRYFMVILSYIVG